MLSQYASPSYALGLLEAGSDGRAYLLKDRVGDADDLVAAVRTVAAGGSVIDPKVVEELVNARARMASSPIDRLTPREREILGEMAQGKSNAAIAATLILSERAVEKHINSIFSKLHLTEEPDVNRRVKAVLVHLAATGWLTTPSARVLARSSGRQPSATMWRWPSVCRVMIVDDQPPFRDAARAVLSRVDGLRAGRRGGLRRGGRDGERRAAARPRADGHQHGRARRHRGDPADHRRPARRRR